MASLRWRPYQSFSQTFPEVVHHNMENIEYCRGFPPIFSPLDLLHCSGFFLDGKTLLFRLPHKKIIACFLR